MQDATDPINALSVLIARMGSLVRPDKGRPALVALDGPVAVGKSTLARALAGGLNQAGMETRIIGADGFLLSTAELAARGLGRRKGAPESFDRPAMASFLRAVAAGEAPAAPTYDHAAYDPSPSNTTPTAGAALVIFEGVNVLGADLSPLYDLRLYLDADLADVETWFLDRFTATPFSAVRAKALAPWRPADGDVESWGRAVWAGVNAPNIDAHIAQGRSRADVVLRKTADHRVTTG